MNMKLFSQREGFKPIKNVIQVKGIDEALLNGLWNALHVFYWDRVTTHFVKDAGGIYKLFFALWLDYFKKPLDTMQNTWQEAYKEIRSYFFRCNWFEVYDFMEFIVNNYPSGSVNEGFIEYCNSILERELSGYRFIGEKIVPITAEEEITEIEEALRGTQSLRPVVIHLKAALVFFSNRKSPEYRNSIKESISAVEAICNVITGKDKATLGGALKAITDKVELHAALQQSFSKLYGYTSDADGIRHALLDEPNLDFEDAKFMLVSCSAFINYLKVKSSKAGIKL